MPIKPIDYIISLQGKLCPHCLAGFMDEAYNTRVTCGKSGINLNTGIPCAIEDWGKCPLNKAGIKVKTRPFKKTLYDTVPVQIYLMQNIKTPLMEGARALFSGGRLIDSCKALRQIYRAIKAVKNLPEPNIENTSRRSARNLIVIRDGFFQRCGLNIIRNSFIRCFINLIIILLQMDGPWRMMILWVKQQADSMDWQEDGDDITRFKWWHEPDGINQKEL